jgi:hypothetical protein
VKRALDNGTNVFESFDLDECKGTGVTVACGCGMIVKWRINLSFLENVWQMVCASSTHLVAIRTFFHSFDPPFLALGIRLNTQNFGPPANRLRGVLVVKEWSESEFGPKEVIETAELQLQTEVQSSVDRMQIQPANLSEFVQQITDEFGTGHRSKNFFRSDAGTNRPQTPVWIKQCKDIVEGAGATWEYPRDGHAVSDTEFAADPHYFSLGPQPRAKVQCMDALNGRYGDGQTTRLHDLHHSIKYMMKVHHDNVAPTIVRESTLWCDSLREILSPCHYFGLHGVDRRDFVGAATLPDSVQIGFCGDLVSLPPMQALSLAVFSKVQLKWNGEFVDVSESVPVPLGPAASETSDDVEVEFIDRGADVD